MSSADDIVARKLAAIPKLSSFTAVFVGMDGNDAVVNVGDNAIRVPCDGFYPPVAGMFVRVEGRNGSYRVTGPAKTESPLGTITTVGTTKVGVDVDGELYPELPFRVGYTPHTGDRVEINWATGVVQGKITVESAPVDPPKKNTPPPKKTFKPIIIRATNSGSYRSRWWTNQVWATDSNSGLWTYGTRVRDGLKGATVTKVEIYLPLITSLNVCNIGLHAYSRIPGGAPSFSSLTNLSHRSGWQRLSLPWAAYLLGGGRGVGVTSGNGFNKWHGTSEDSLSGALRFHGSR